MRKFLLTLYLVAFTLAAEAQMSQVQLVRYSGAGDVHWQILGENYQTIHSSSEFQGEDSVNILLRSYCYYILVLNITSINKPAAKLFILSIEGEPVIATGSDSGPGPHSYRFFTGIQPGGAKIIGGYAVSISNYPWQVFYVSGNFQCGGSIIAKKWVLTAAHCTKNSDGSPVSPSLMFVKVGANDPYNASEGKVYNVSQAIAHPSYNSTTNENDIALLRLSDSINFPNASPVKLLSAYDESQGVTDPGVISTVTGWGLTSVNPQILPLSLQRVDLPIVTSAVAALIYGSVPATVIMAGYLYGNKSSCSGDSGGPLVVPVYDETKLAGIVSFGDANCDAYGGYTRVSLFANWIQSNTGIVPDYIPQSPMGTSILCQGVDSTQYSAVKSASITSYEWKLDPSNAGAITGSSDLVTVKWSPGFTGTVSLRVRVTINGNASEWAIRNINIYPNTSIIGQPRDTTLCQGSPVTLNITATGYNLTYQWYQNNSAVIQGNSNNLVYNNLVPENTGIYYCSVSGTCGNLISKSVNLTVYPTTRITNSPSDTVIPYGSSISLNVKSEGRDLTYQWEKDNTLVANSNSQELSLSDVNAESIGLYKVLINGTCGSDISKPVYLYVQEQYSQVSPGVFLWPDPAGDIINVALGNENLYDVHIISTAGKVVIEKLNCRRQIQIDVSRLAGGIYIVEIYGSGFRRSVRMIKK